MTASGVTLMALILALLVDVARPFNRLQVALDRDEVQTAVARICPLTGRYLDLVTYAFSQPRIAFDPVMERIVFTLQLDLSIAGHDLRGRATGSGTVRFDAVRGSMFLDRVEITEMPITGLAGDLAAHLQAPLRHALIGSLDALVLYQRPMQPTSNERMELWTIRALTVREGRMTVVLGR